MLFIKDIKSFEIDGDNRKSMYPIPLVTKGFNIGQPVQNTKSA